MCWQKLLLHTSFIVNLKFLLILESLSLNSGNFETDKFSFYPLFRCPTFLFKFSHVYITHLLRASDVFHRR